MRKRIGEYLVEEGVLTKVQVDQILAHSAQTGLRFGEAGVSIGLLPLEILRRLFGPNYQVDFFHVSARHFPKSTQGLFTPEFLIQNGVLPLGIKREFRFFRARKRLNLGFLNPADPGLIDRVRAAAPEFLAFKVFLILPDQLAEVLQDVYGVAGLALSSLPAPKIHPLLKASFPTSLPVP